MSNQQDYVTDFNLRMERGDYTGAYIVFHDHPDLVRKLTDGYLISSLDRFVTEAMVTEGKEFFEAARNQIKDRDNLKLMEFLASLLYLRNFCVEVSKPFD